MDDWKQKPLFEDDQVVTDAELRGIYNGFYEQYLAVPRWQILRRYYIAGCMYGVELIIGWLQEGKKVENYYGKDVYED